jgi:hypothetical protein
MRCGRPGRTTKKRKAHLVLCLLPVRVGENLVD